MAIFHLKIDFRFISKIDTIITTVFIYTSAAVDLSCLSAHVVHPTKIGDQIMLRFRPKAQMMARLHAPTQARRLNAITCIQKILRTRRVERHYVPERQGQLALQEPDHGVEERGGQRAQQPLEQHQPEVGHVAAHDVLDHLALHRGHEYGHERAAHQSQRVHGQQAHLGCPQAGHHEPEQLLELDEELTVDAGSGGRPGLFRGRFLGDDRRRQRRRSLRVVVVVGLAGRSPSPRAAVFGRFAGRRAASAAHPQHDRVADLAAVQQHGRGQHSLADVVPADDALVQVLGDDGRHGRGGRFRTGGPRRLGRYSTTTAAEMTSLP